MENAKQKITDKFIDLLPFESWSAGTLAKAAAEAGIEESYVKVVYPGGIEEFTKEFVAGCNAAAFEKLRNIDPASMKITQKAQEIIFQRIAAYHERLKNPEGLKKFATYSANPVHLGASLKNIYEFSSEAWYEMGDKSTDFSYYTKRLSFSAIYSKSILYSLSDKSNNLEQTRKFIKKSIDDLMKINKLKQKVNDFISYLPGFTKAKF